MTGRESAGERAMMPSEPVRHERGLAVLVVDDRKTNLRVLSKLAGQLAEFIHVGAYQDSRAALAAAIAAPPDLIVTDYKMPHLNGAEFVRKLRSNPATREVPVVIVTAYEDKQFRYDALMAGASDFLLSPVDRLEFIQRSRNLLTLRSQQEALKRQAEERERRLAAENRLRERELRFSEEKFRLVVNVLPALINATDLDGRLEFANAYHARLFGVEPETATGRTLGQLFPFDYADRHKRANQKVSSTGEPLAFEETIEPGSGEPITLLTSKAPLRDLDDRVTNVLTVSLDMTEQKKVETELAAAKEQAQCANRTKTEFLANISHELRTPLNAILGFAEIGRQEMFGPIGSTRYRVYQQDIHDSASQLLKLIDDLLDISKLELGRLEAKPEDIDLSTETDRALQAVAEEAAVYKTALKNDTPTQLGRLRSDPLRLQQILVNLLSNAVKYGKPKGTVHLYAERTAEGGVRLTVADDGPGMAAEEVKIALSRFGRLGRVATQNRPGAGLGLPIAKDLARLLGGRLTLESRPGHGTRITVELPNMPESQAPAPACQPGAGSAGTGEGHRE